MKKATFTLLTIFFMLLMGACGNRYDDEITRLKTRIETLEEKNEHTEKQNEELTKKISDVTSRLEVVEKKEKSNEIAITENRQSTVIDSSVSVTSGVSSVNAVKAIYNGKFIALKIFNDEKSAEAEATDIYLGYALREISFIVISDTEITQITINGEKVDYSREDNMMFISYYMPGGGNYTIKVETSNGVFYASIVY